MITKFNQYKMNEEYGLPIDRTKQQFIIKEIAKNINPDFIVMFDQYSIQVSISQSKNSSGKFNNEINLYKVSDCLLQLIQLEKELIENGITKKQTPNLYIDNARIKMTLSIVE